MIVSILECTESFLTKENVMFEQTVGQIIFCKICDVIKEVLNRDCGQITCETKLIDDLKCDRIGFAGICLSLEELFDVQIPWNELLKAVSVRDIFLLVRKQTHS